MPKLFIGLDISFTGTGIAGISEDRTYFFSSLLKDKLDKSEKRRGIRYQRISTKITDALDLGIEKSICETSEIIITIEHFSYRSIGRTFDLAELTGFVKRELFRYLSNKSISFTILECPPTKLKQFATGNGRAKKPEMVSACNKILNLNIKDHNEADALLLSELGRIVFLKDGKTLLGRDLASKLTYF